MTTKKKKIEKCPRDHLYATQSTLASNKNKVKVKVYKNMEMEIWTNTDGFGLKEKSWYRGKIAFGLENTSKKNTTI